uniref:HMA domain-containing protein n=1 Tax=uncultured Bacteroidota bacterium TaxID=152509 RepID=H5SK48_9BACT|nr:hypothetical protein HGMM_F40B03C22 [uncultured Bacteroidetes bacterium]
MRTLAYMTVATLLWVGLAKADGEKASRMVLKVDKAQVEAAQKALAGIEGIRSVKYEEKESELVIFYDKPKLGCCSRIHSALKSAGVTYTLVSNKEYPACSGKHEEGHSDAGTSTPVQTVKGKKGKKGCCSGAKSSSCEGKAS